MSREFPATLAVGEVFTADVAFDEQGTDAPTSHAASFVIETTVGSVTVPLTAVTPPGCSLLVVPNSLTFGNVAPDRSITELLKLANVGSIPCTVTGVGLTPETDPLFTLAATPGTSTVKPNDALNLSVTFDAATATAPFEHTGLLTFESVEQGNATVEVPLSAYVNSACSAVTPLIYTVDSDGTFSRFDPDTLTFAVIGQLACPDISAPLHMAVDLNNVAWVGYQDGELFQVQTSDAGCTPTGFQVNQDGIFKFGMGFLFDPYSGQDTLYVAGGPIDFHEDDGLATMAFPSLALTAIGPLAPWGLPIIKPFPPPVYAPPDLAGTADGQLWGFAPGPNSVTGLATLAQLDPATGATLQSFSYAPFAPSAFAMKFWRGYLWIFLDSDLVRVDRNDGSMQEFLSGTGHEVVGAGVSDCAPVQ